MNGKVLEARRALFEAWHCERFKAKYSNGQPTRDMHNGVYAECYTVQIEQERWLAFNAALDAVEIDLDSAVRTMPSPVSKGTMWSAEVRAAIESTNLGLRVK